MNAEKTPRSHNRVSKYVNRQSYGRIRDELTDAGLSHVESYPVKDILLRSAGGDKVRGRGNSLSEKFIIRCISADEPRYFLLKECTKGNQIKELCEPITHEVALRIMERSTRWLCASSSPLVHEIGVKMVTDRLVPDTIIRYTRECFDLSPKTTITADSGISLSEYNLSDAFTASSTEEPVDRDTCLLQVNYERIIPESISYIIGLKNHIG